jgi:hypothetical protein
LQADLHRLQRAAANLNRAKKTHAPPLARESTISRAPRPVCRSCNTQENAQPRAAPPTTKYRQGDNRKQCRLRP